MMNPMIRIRMHGSKLANHERFHHLADSTWRNITGPREDNFTNPAMAKSNGERRIIRRTLARDIHSPLEYLKIRDGLLVRMQFWIEKWIQRVQVLPLPAYAVPDRHVV